MYHQAAGIARFREGETCGKARDLPRIWACWPQIGTDNGLEPGRQGLTPLDNAIRAGPHPFCRSESGLVTFAANFGPRGVGWLYSGCSRDIPKTKKLARSMLDSTKGRNLDPARIAAWEHAICERVEDLLAVLPGCLGQAAVTVLAYELARVYAPPENRTQAERPDKWAAAIASHVEGLFPDREGAAAAVEYLAGRMARAFEPPRRIGTRQPAGNGYTEGIRLAKNKIRNKMPPPSPTLEAGSRIAAWHRALLFDVHQLMPKDPLVAEAVTAALAVRLAYQLRPPFLRQRTPERPQPSADSQAVEPC